ncbi:ribose-phosphate pyrophosphokinase [Mycoplasmopsis gallopavonis]|uniref:Ribose-phosphate pyrophosphokinase n=1 Tax=Mycoplasmopsis gallopavonis TaxID=76629 RepID=A0A449AYL0_9BACT|nr:ribose-phosphate pyrophosphokinase [Mycoplasmopsis gallopavonis]RIV16193.1 ribose-phosphate pyrophosphokinase [Mycoplasmopsis gallopavonis]VEU72584.1 Ribose-phosphate pyrophosphokinase [Mycoplasmopsis gallopavonis]
MNKNNSVLFGMENSLKLAQRVSEIIGLPLSKVQKTVYADGEVMMVSEPTVRDKDVFIIASTSRPVNDNIVELLIFLDSLKRASAKSINVCLSYYGYARQDRKASGRQPIGAKLVADLLQTAGATKVVCVDLHNPSIQGFFNIPVDDLKGQYPLAKALKSLNEKFTVVSPDHGGTVRARKLAELIADTVKICIIDKRRTGVNQTEVMGLIGDIADQNAVIVDDIIDTGGTILKAVDTLKSKGAKKVIVVATHGIFTKGFEIFENNPNVEKVIVTDSIDNYELAKKFTKLQIVSLGDFLAKVINASLSGGSISNVYLELKEEIQKI